MENDSGDTLTHKKNNSSGTSGDRDTRADTEGYSDMDRDHGPELRVATDAQGGTDRARSLGRPSASAKGNCYSGKTNGE